MTKTWSLLVNVSARGLQRGSYCGRRDMRTPREVIDVCGLYISYIVWRYIKYTVDPWIVGVRAPTFHIVENPHMIYSWPSVAGCLRIWGSSSLDSTASGLCSTLVFTTEKNLHISGPLQFKVQGSTVYRYTHVGIYTISLYNPQRQQISGCQGMGEVGDGEWLLMDMGCPFGVMRMFWN